MGNGERKLIGAYLDGEDLVEFEKVQNHLGIRSKSDVVRYLIRQAARETDRQAVTARLVEGWALERVTAQEAMECLATVWPE